MIETKKIRTAEDINALLRYVIFDLGLGWDFHPDDDFSAYGKPDKDEARFSDEESELLNQQIDRCFEVAEKIHKDIYKLTLDLQLTIPEER